MGSFEYYLIGINVLGFILYLINMWLYDHTAESNVDKLLTIVSLLGGSAGPLLAILLFDRKSVKQNNPTQNNERSKDLRNRARLRRLAIGAAFLHEV